MAKQLNVNMAFSANTSKAKQQIQELQQSLTNLYSTSAQNSSLPLNTEIQTALNNVAKLKVALEQSINTSTGNLDLSRFSAQLDKSGISLKGLATDLINLGPQGEQTFMQLARSVVQAETPMRQTNALLGTMWTTLKNVARFQISSSIMHGLIGGIQTAYGYAQDLNESLNNIRIVTGQSSEQMARFAQEANKTARSLSATTLDYTNASLIYYQQGLDDDAVRERTDVTIKMANVAHESAETVSEQLTAIWNNFDDGSKSLEYYADVITALGAATASSSSEISAGLNKFAAVADTVGLSYENATAALATITATTRQSADTVGTGLRTLFSRLQGLSLGKTLEDGVNLNKYSEALAKVGVQALDASGNLRRMDEVLEDLGARWGTLTEAQQTALAQTVGGVRQYTTLVALMDNWDFMKQNQQVAAGAEGTLQNQADIYAESWEAARDRVKAAVESLYDTLIDENFFIGVDKVIEHILVGLNSFIQSIGGLPTVLSLLGTGLLTAFGPQISSAIDGLIQNIKIMRGEAEALSIQVKEDMIQAVQTFNKGYTLDGETRDMNYNVLEGEVTERELQRTIDLQKQVSSLNDEQRKYRQELIELEAQYGKVAVAAAKSAEEATKNVTELTRSLSNKAFDKGGIELATQMDNVSSKIKNYAQELINAKVSESEFSDKMNLAARNLKAWNPELNTTTTSLYNLGMAYRNQIIQTNNATQALNNYDNRIQETDSLMATSIIRIQSFGESFVQIGRTLGQTAMAISSIKGLINTLSNPNISGLDKLTSIFTTLMMTTPMIVGVFKPLMTATTAWAASNSYAAMSINLVKMGLAEEEASLAATLITKNAAIFSTEALSTAEGVQTAVQFLVNNGYKEETAQSLVAAAAKGKLTTATLAHTAAMIKQKAMMLITNPVFWIAVAAITALTAAIWLSVKAYQAEAENAKKAAEAAQELNNKSKEATQKAQEIKDTFSKYDTAVEALNKCTKGTEEWYAALKNVNDIILDILQNNPELAASLQTHRDDNGMLVIDNAEQIIKQAEQTANQAKYASIMGNTSAAQARLISNQTNTYRQFAEYEGEDRTNFEAIQRNQVRSKIIQNASDYLGLTQQEFQTKALEEGLSLAGEGLENFYKAIQTLGQESDNLSNQMEIAGNLIAEQELGDKFDAATKEIVSENYEKLYTDIYNQILKDEDKITKWAGANNKDVKALWERYSKATGTNYSLSTNAVQGSAIGSNTASRSYEYIDAEGKKVQVSIREMAAAIAASEALQKLGASAQQAATLLNNIKIDENAGYDNSDIRNYLANNNFENSTEGSINAMRTEMEEVGGAQAYLEQIFGGADKLKELAELQKISVEDFVKNFENSLNSIDFSTIGDNLSPHAKQAFEKAQEYMGDLNYAGQKQLADLYQVTFNEMGQAGTKSLSDALSVLSSSGKLDEFEQIASTFDWTSGSITEFKEQLKNAGIAVDSLNLDPWIQGMYDAKQAITDFTSASTNYKTLHDIIDDIKVGDTLTPEQWDTLGEGYEEYFVLMSDGTHMLVGDAEEFFNKVNTQSLEGFTNTLKELEKTKNDITTISEKRQISDLTTVAGERGIYGSTYRNGEDTTNTQLLSDQLDFLRATGQGNTELVQEAQAKLDNNESFTYEELQKIASIVTDVSANYETWADVIKDCDNQLEQNQEAIASSAASVGDLQDRSEKYNLTQEAVNKGYMALATQTEEGQEALAQYRKEIKEAGNNTEKAKEATLKFQKAIKDIQATNAAKAIKELNINLDKLSDNDAEKVAEQLQKVFGDSVTREWVQNHKDLIKQWLDGTEEQRQAAANQIDNYTALEKIISNFDETTINSQDGLAALTGQLEANANAAELFANNFINLKQLLTQGFTELNGIKFNIDGTADMSSAIQSMISAGKTAQEVAQFIEEAGLSHVQFSLSGTPIPDMPDFSNTEAWIEWYNNNIAKMEPSNITGSGEWSANAGKPQMTSAGGGGGGGGGSNKKTHEQKTRDGGDRYRPIKAKQEDKSRQINQAREKADRLAGKARIDNLKEENKLLGDNIKLQQQYIDEINNYLAQDKSDMLSKFGDFGISLNFDENGVINNYDSIMDRMYAIYNEKANQELDEDTWKEFEEGWQAAIDALDQYVETRDLAEEETANLADMINEQFDQLLEMAATKLELDIQVDDQDLKFLDYLLNKIDDDAYKAAEAIALMGDKAARELERANYYQNAINQTLAAYGISSIEQLANMSPEELQNLGITQDTVDNLIDWNNELLDTASTLDELQSEILDKVISGFDDLNEKVQDSYDYFSHWNTVLENYRDIVDLNMSALGGKQARDLIKTIDNSMLKNSVNALRSSKQIYDDLVKSRAEAEAKLQEAVAAGRIGDIQRYEDVLADIDEKIKDSQEQWLSDWSDGLQKAQDILTRAVEDAVAEYDKLLSPVYGSLDYLSEAYDRGKEVDEDYVQDYEKLYQLNKLNRDLTKVLGDTDGLKNKEQLIKLQEKINKLQKDNTKMSEYDLEVLRKEFEVQQARIALEEAANAKSTVRLQRDNEGNWGYVYTSDFDSTEELQQSYEDKLHEYQQLNDEYMSEMSDKLMELSQDARDRISEIWSDATLTQEEKEARVAEVMKWFNAQRDYIEEQMGHAIDNQAALTDRFYATYQNMQAQVRDTFAETVLSQTTNIAQLSEMTGLLTTGVANLVESGRLASLEYLASMEEINEAAGSTMQDLADNITNATHEIDIASNANVETISELSEVVQEELLNALDSAIEQEERLAASIGATTDAIEAQTAALNNMLRVLNNTAGGSIDINNNPLDTLSQSSEKYGINQPSYNENDWILNHNMTDIFDALYDEEKWNISHEDFLDMYSAIQDWMNILSTQTISAMQGFGSIMSPYYQTPEADELEQNVHIEANFPGVTDSSAIEEAFENLVNKAAQFANRKRQG